MTLTVRLKPDLESAVARYCAEQGVTKSHLVQEALAEYLVRPVGRRAPASQAAAPAKLSDNYRAFEALGLIGCADLGGRPADKARVREVITERMAARKARRDA